MRGILAVVALVLGLVLVPLGDLGIWARQELLSRDALTENVVEIVDEPAVERALEKRIVEQLVEQEPNLAQVQAGLTTAVGVVLESEPFHDILRGAVGGLHDQITDGEGALTLDLREVVPLVRAAAEDVDPDVASEIPPDLTIEETRVLQDDDASSLLDAVDVLDLVSWVLPVLSLLLLAGAVFLAKRRIAMLVVAGAGLAILSLVVGIAMKALKGSVADAAGSSVDKDAFEGAYGVLADGLFSLSIVLAVVGVVVVAVGVGVAMWRRANERESIWA